MKPTHCEACGAEGKVGALSGLCAVCEDDVALHTAALELVDLELPAARLCPICEREVGSDLGGWSPCAACRRYTDRVLHKRFKVTRDEFQQAFGAKKKTEDKAA